MGITSINVKSFNLVSMRISDYHKGYNTGEYYFTKDTYRANETIEPSYRVTYCFTSPSGKEQMSVMTGSTLLEAFDCLEEFKEKHKPLLNKRYWK